MCYCWLQGQHWFPIHVLSVHGISLALWFGSWSIHICHGPAPVQHIVTKVVVQLSAQALHSAAFSFRCWIVLFSVLWWEIPKYWTEQLCLPQYSMWVNQYIGPKSSGKPDPGDGVCTANCCHLYVLCSLPWAAKVLGDAGNLRDKRCYYSSLDKAVWLLPPADRLR